MTLRELQTRKDLTGPAARRHAVVACRADGRHELIATPAQLRRLPVVSDGLMRESRYCDQCWTVFGPDGSETGAPVI